MKLSDAAHGSHRGAGEELRCSGPPAGRRRAADDIIRLQGCINDLVSLLALPALWSGRDPEQLVTTLLEVLVRMLRLDFAYALLRGEGDAAQTEMVRLGSVATPRAWPRQIGQAFTPWLESDPQNWPPTLPNPVGRGDVSIVPCRLGLRERVGIVVVGSGRAGFPRDTDTLLLSVAVNQAAIGLQEIRALGEQKRIARDLDQRIAQRTQELAAINEELRREIGERTRVEEKLRQDEEELRRITDVIPQAIIVLAPDGSMLHANAFVLEYTGLGLEDLTADGVRGTVFHPDDVERLWDERHEALSRGEPFELELRARRRDGRYRWFLVRHAPFRDESGSITRWYATGTDIEDRKRAEEKVRNENLALREEIDRSSMSEEVVGSSEGLRRVMSQVAKVAPTDSTVLILGETGTGKELIARAIHRQSSRSNQAFIRVNCAAIPPSLIASELFGHEKGAFTGALQRRLGRFESASGGTIFLDEIGDLPAETQIALLRVLQEREFERIGSNRPISADVRVLAATHRDLKAAVKAGTFREDLFYRLNVFPLEIPPLRERRDDIPLLVEYTIARYAGRAGKSIRSIGKRTLEAFRTYDWPGNVRELQNVVERAVILCDGGTFVVDETWFKRETNASGGQSVSLPGSLARSEREMIEAALAASRGRVSGPSGAAVRLGIARQTLESKIKALDIDKHRFKPR
jgi:formate hydrogenlyase transcriptional activator